jgi:antitoxin (DNA-binding transcriptional repressor) of toxin-antitoxin stability system
MPAILTVEEAQSRLKELIDKLAPGEEIVLTENQQRVAKLVGERPARPPRPAPGLGKGSILYMAPDFDEPLDEFKEYMEDLR